MPGRAVYLSIALFCCLVSFAVGGAAGAEQYQTTRPDACAVLRHSDVAPLFGGQVHSVANKSPLPVQSGTAEEVNQVLQVSETQCTWADLTKLTHGGRFDLLTVVVLDRNEDYSGDGEPWSASREKLISVAVGTTKAYNLRDNDNLAKKLHQPHLAGDDVFIVTDRKTDGRKRAILGYDFGGGIWAYFAARTYDQNALNAVIAATKRVVAG